MSQAPLEVGRYVLYDAIASGGMAAVHLGRIVGPAGFSRVVAIKRLHPHLVTDKKFATMFLDEARVASRIHHPNVVGVIDVADLEGELFLVMDYVRGEALSALLRTASEQHELVPVPIVAAIMIGVLYGLHAAHEARDERGQPMHVVHRDVSPQNVLVDLDGIVRVADFGIAKAKSRLESTREGEVKGKLAYMAPEQLRSGTVDRRTDVYAASVVMWEALTARRLFKSDDAGGIVLAVMEGNVARPSRHRSDVTPEIDALVLRGLARDPDARYATALEMADAIAELVRPAPPREIGTWVARLGGDALSTRLSRIAELERQALPRAGAAQSDERQRAVDAVTAVVSASGPGAAAESASPLDAVSARPAESALFERAPRARGRAVAIIAFAAAAAAAAGAVAVLREAQPSDVALPKEAPSAHASVASTPLETASALPAPALAPSTTETVSVAPESSIAPASHVTPSGPRHVARSSPHPHAGAAPAASSKSNDCDPPFTVDQDGIKRFKRWCPQ